MTSLIARNLFVVGSGFTRAAFPDAPLNRDLLKALVAKGNRSSAKLMELYRAEDIEIALTRLDCDISLEEASGGGGGRARRLRDSVEAELAGYFLEYCASEQLLAESPWLTALLNHGIKPGDVAISLNYDCLLEGALDCLGKWSPRGGYGLPGRHPLVESKDFRKSPVTVLKIHGSASFVIAPIIGDEVSNSIGPILNGTLFPRSGKNRVFGFGGGAGRQYVIAPSYVKVPAVEIAYLMLSALDAARKAKNLVFIGTSIRPEDQFLTILMTRFFSRRGWRQRRIVVVSPSAEVVCERIRRYWGSHAVSDHIKPIAKPVQIAIEELLTAIR